MMRKLVFFDVDGTLVTRNNHVPNSTINAIEKLKENGVVPVIATGRSPVLIREITEKVRVDSYIAMNGQYIVHEGEVIYDNPISEHLVDAVIEMATERRDGILLSSADELITDSVISLSSRGSWLSFLKGLVGLIPERVQLSLLKRLMNKTPKKEDYTGKDIFMMNVNAGREEQRLYEAVFSEHLAFTRASEMMMDVINKGTSKATGAEQMMSLLGVSHKDTYAFGDGLNDLEIIQFVGTGVAMANGFDELKAVADIVTASVFDDGISKGLQKLELI
jgi:hypothetical protein